MLTVIGLVEIPVPLGFEPRCFVQSVGIQDQVVDEYPGRNKVRASS